MHAILRMERRRREARARSVCNWVLAAWLVFLCSFAAGVQSLRAAAFNGVPAAEYTHFAGAGGPTTIKSGMGLLHTVTVNTPIAAGTVTIADGSNTIAIITVPAAAANPFELTFDAVFFTSLVVTITGAMDVTVNWQ
jgi:hypothetical protein